jgi:spore maturation protein CgeB
MSGLSLECEVLPARSGVPTLRVNGIFLHSRYDPEQEAARLIDSAGLDPQCPVAVAGMGLGYHVAELVRRGHEVHVVEPAEEVARLALEHGPAKEGFTLYRGPALDALPPLANAQILAHPPTEKLHPGLAARVEGAIARAALKGRRLNVAIAGPMYGGSLPIAGYLERAFQSLGHNTLLVDNAMAWPLYRQVMEGMESPHASAQLQQLLGHFLNEWTYGRIAEFDPEICIVMAQALAPENLAARLAQRGTVTAFWFVENWRHMPYWQQVAPAYDAFFHIQPGDFEQRLEEAGCRHHAFIPTGCDPGLHRPVTLSLEEQVDYGCDLSFAGAGYFNRLQLFKGLTDFNFKIWGVDWKERELLPLVQRGEQRFDSEIFMKIAAASKVNLNLHSSTTHDGVDPACDAVNPRVFEIAAAGAFQLCDACKGLDALFTEEEVPTYRSLGELRDKLKHYLARPAERAAIAARARERALRDHTYAHRAQAMLDFLLERHGGRILQRGVRTQRTVAEQAALLPESDALRTWLESLPVDTPFTQEALNEHIAPEYNDRDYPQHLLHYMREVRNFAEGLIKAMD